MTRIYALLKVCMLLFAFLMLSAMSGCPRELGDESAGSGSSEVGAGSGSGGDSGSGGGSGY
jgi:uncharacterized membrane protein YgcG